MKTRKFKLIKKYPKSPEVGQVLEFYENQYGSIPASGYSIQECLNYPEYWQEQFKFTWFWGKDKETSVIEEWKGFNDLNELKAHSYTHSKAYLTLYPEENGKYWSNYTDNESNESNESK